jgi:hypothetical protein
MALVTSNHDINELFDCINTVFHKLCNYFCQNKLSLDLDKTKYLLISPNVNIPTIGKYIFTNNNIGGDDASCIFKLHKITFYDKIPAINTQAFTLTKI